MSNLTVTTRFTKNTGQPATGLTLAQIDLYLVSINKSSGAIATVWNPQPPTAEVGGGEYLRVYSSADFETFDYRARAQYTGSPANVDSPYAYSHGSDNPADPWVMPTRTLTSFGTLVADIWTSASRTLTASLDPSAATIATAVWVAASRTLTAFGFSVTVGTNNDKTGYSLSVAGIQAITADILAGVIEVGLTLKNALRLIAASAAGKLSGAATTQVKLRSAVADDKDRIDATVDSDGNRTAITYDLSD